LQFFRLSRILSHVIHRLDTTIPALERRLAWFYEQFHQDMSDFDKRLKELEQHKQDTSNIDKQLEDVGINCLLDHHVKNLNPNDPDPIQRAGEAVRKHQGHTISHNLMCMNTRKTT
jgi:hypothetical protein